MIFFWRSARRAGAIATLGVLFTGCAEELPETPPRQLTSSPFQYPETLWDEGVEGEATLKLFVTAQGVVDTARIEKPSGYAPFDSAALVDARKLRFEPARRGEEPVGVWVLLPVQYRLTSDPAALDSLPQDTAATDTL